MSTRLYVGNLPTRTTDADLTELFTPFGAVDAASVVMDKNTGRSRGFAFIEMGDGADAAVRAVNGSSFQGRRVMVSEAEPRPVRPASPLAPLASGAGRRG